MSHARPVERLVVAADPGIAERVAVVDKPLEELTALDRGDLSGVTELVLVVVADEPDAGLRSSVHDRLRADERLDRVTTVSVISSPAEELATTLADRPEILADGKAVVDLVTGPEAVRRSLRVLSALWGSLIVERSHDGDTVLLTQERSASNALLIAALRLTVLCAEHTADTDLWVVTRGLVGLVAQEAPGYRLTRTCHALFQDLSLTGLPDHDSACAELLDRLGERERADELHRLIARWHRQRIWSRNFVPEMVLHDDAHSVSVDRHVAALCEPLIERGVLDAEDLYVLALAAWLHDWGHESAELDGHLVVDPVDVRNVHGELSRVKLLMEHQRHGIAPGTRLNEVALLCAHHQGWTSASRKPVDAKAPSSSARHYTWADDRKLGIKPLLAGRAFDDEHRALGEGATAIEKAHLRLTLLRLADAMDIGVHRVPDQETMQIHHEAIIKEYAQRAVQQAPGSEGLIEKMRGEAGKLIVHRAHSDPEYDVEVSRRLGVPEDALEVSPSSQRDTRVVHAAWRYFGHVAGQRGFYGEHSRVRAVVPALIPEGGTPGGYLRLVLHVVPTAGDVADEARTDVRNAVLRELGPLDPDEPKAALRTYLEAARIRSDVESVAVAPPPAPTTDDPLPDEDPEPEPFGIAVPFFEADGSVWWRGLHAPDGAGELWTADDPTRRPADAIPIAMSSDATYVAGVLDGKMFVVSTADRQTRSLQVSDESRALAVSTDGDLTSVLVGSPTGASVSWLPVYGREQQIGAGRADRGGALSGAFVGSSALVVDGEGELWGDLAGSLFGSTRVVCIDAVLARPHFFAAGVPASATGRIEVRSGLWTGMRAVDVRSDSLLVDGSVDEVRWIRRWPADRPTALVWRSGATWHRLDDAGAAL